MKIELDKYYTDPNLSKELIEQTLDFIGRDKIDTIIEPSAGNGSFSNYLFDEYYYKYKILAYDIQPESERIQNQDFLKLELPFNTKCLIIGNPPFGSNRNLLTQFINKSYQISNYVAYILPISWLNKNNLKNLDLIYSQDLKEQLFSNIKLKCCFNIYKYNKDKKIDNLKLKGIEVHQEAYGTGIYDFKIQRLGNYLGKILDNNSSIKSWIEVKINLDDKIKDKIIDVINNYDWNTVRKVISIPYLNVSDVYKVLMEQIKELEIDSTDLQINNETFDEFFEI
jgi:predicted RNA methylase